MRRLFVLVGVTPVLTLYVTGSLYLASERAIAPTDAVPKTLPTWAYGPAASSLEAFNQFLNGDRARSVQWAGRAIDLQPRSQTAVALLGMIAELNGNTADAERLMALSARLGHRNYLVESWYFDKAAIEGDLNAQAEHADAIFRLDDDDPMLEGQLVLLEKSRRGRAALLKRFASPARWQDRYIRNVADLDPDALERRAQLVLELGQTQRARARKLLAPVVLRMIEQGGVAKAHRLWSRVEPLPNGGLLRDGAFTLRDYRVAQPFGWQFSSRADMSATIERDFASDAPVLRVSGGRGRVKMAEQLVVLHSPARYRLDIDLAADDGASPRLLLHVRPVPNAPGAKDILVPFQEMAEGVVRAEFDISGKAEGHAIEIWLDHGASEPPVSFSIGKVALTASANR